MGGVAKSIAKKTVKPITEKVVDTTKSITNVLYDQEIYKDDKNENENENENVENFDPTVSQYGEGYNLTTEAAKRRKQLLALQRGFQSTIRANRNTSENNNFLKPAIQTGKLKLGQ